MSAHEIEPRLVDPGIADRDDSVHRGDPVTVDRYTAGARVNHWITATCLVLLAISGLALLHPSLFFLTGLFALLATGATASGARSALLDRYVKTIVVGMEKR